jgi:hypothetical protein
VDEVDRFPDILSEDVTRNKLLMVFTHKWRALLSVAPISWDVFQLSSQTWSPERQTRLMQGCQGAARRE